MASLLLCIDTSTADVTAAVVRLDDADAPVTLATRTSYGATQHAERLAPNVETALGDAQVLPRMLTGVVVGVGPGPFTGLRVGIATAAAIADALAIPAYAVCSLDGIETGDGGVLVATDARRKEVYWATYSDGVRADGPAVDTPSRLVEVLQHRRFNRVVLGGADRYADLLGPLGDEVTQGRPTGSGLVAAALAQGVLDRVPGPLTPLYLRRPDATVPGTSTKSAVQPTVAQMRERTR